MRIAKRYLDTVAFLKEAIDSVYPNSRDRVLLKAENVGGYMTVAAYTVSPSMIDKYYEFVQEATGFQISALKKEGRQMPRIMFKWIATLIITSEYNVNYFAISGLFQCTHGTTISNMKAFNDYLQTEKEFARRLRMLLAENGYEKSANKLNEKNNNHSLHSKLATLQRFESMVETGMNN